jgi:hypothetical protein
MKTNSAPSTSGTGLKPGREILKPFVGVSCSGGEVGRFHDPSRPYLHPEDVDIALEIDRYGFTVRIEVEDGRPIARMERPT